MDFRCRHFSCTWCLHFWALALLQSGSWNLWLSQCQNMANAQVRIQYYCPALCPWWLRGLDSHFCSNPTPGRQRVRFCERVFSSCKFCAFSTICTYTYICRMWLVYICACLHVFNAELSNVCEAVFLATELLRVLLLLCAPSTAACSHCCHPSPLSFTGCITAHMI